MDFVKSFDFFGIPATQIPSIPGSGVPTEETEGAVGCLYMNTDTGTLYKCVAAVDGVYTWEEIDKATLERMAQIEVELDGKASAGYGYGEELASYAVETEAELEANLSEILSDMSDYTTKQTRILLSFLGVESYYLTTVYKHTENFALVTFQTMRFKGATLHKVYTSSSWQPLEWENPPMEANTEYRTTERIHGKAVYKTADDAGNIVYRLDGESAWLEYADLIGGNTLINLMEQLTITGSGIYSGRGSVAAGVFSNTAGYTRSDYIPVKSGDILNYTNAQSATNFAIFAIYNSEKVCTYARTTENASKSNTYEITEDGYIVISLVNSAIPNATMQLKTRREGSILALRKNLSILVIGNSFSQDSFAYLPPVLNEILHDYNITYGVAYTSGASIYDQVNTNPSASDAAAAVIARGLKYTYFNYWDSTAVKWDRQNMVKTFNDIMSMRKWDIIYLQPAGSSSDDSVIKKNIITPGRTILRLLQDLNGGPFSLLVGQHLAQSETSFACLCNGMKRAKEWLGVVDTIPIGVAIQNARTNAEWAKLEGEGIGTAGAQTAPYTDATTGETKYKTPYPLLYKDCTHMQAGIPALIATYTIALKVLEILGESHRGIYGSTFVPTQEKCVAIGAGSPTGETAMTHGYSRGIVDETTGGILTENIKLAQEIAYLAVNNPMVKTDLNVILA